MLLLLLLKLEIPEHVSNSNYGDLNKGILSYASGFEGYVERRIDWTCIVIFMLFNVCYNNNNNGDSEYLNIVTDY